MLDEETILKILKAGDIAKRAIKYATSLIRPGAGVLEVAVAIEKYVVELGGAPAFPVNIGINSVAAHYTPLPDDYTTIQDNSVVKVDIGVHIEGYIADVATTLTFNPVYEGLVEATRTALERAIEIVRPGIRAVEIGKVVEESVRSAGFKPIKNLSGHGIEKYKIHSGVVIPNYNDQLNRYKLEEGIYAIEPFATNGVGLVDESNLITIYALRSRPPKTQSLQARKFYEQVYSERRGLPFTLRWYTFKDLSRFQIESVLNSLRKNGCLIEYPVLIEKAGGVVAQFEHTIVVAGKEVIVVTT